MPKEQRPKLLGAPFIHDLQAEANEHTVTTARDA